MEIKTLESASVAEITNTFNLAFSNYLISIFLTENDLRIKMTSENTIPGYSAGVFSEGMLVGFILIGIDNNVAYNGGTGVIPEFRGQNLTRKMYDFLLPLLAEEGITSHLLEVITENAKAIPVYEKIGFTIVRTVACFKGKINHAENHFADICTIDFPGQMEAWCDFKPTYQNATPAILRTKETHQFLGAFVEGKMVGCIAFIESNARIKHFAVAPEFRRKGIGGQLFDQVQQRVGDKPVLLINVDESDESMAFLQKIGLEIPLRQYEMVYRYDGPR
jgi:ribosomal protein S18 acetylase RimI-like enzyme